jgi:medium-chain acyl-[acyl-carrier-protein] hydrolase
LGPSYRKAHTLQFSHCGKDGLVRPDALLDILQDAAAAQAGALGLGAAAMAARGLGWALARERALVDRPLRAGDAVEVATWPRGVERGLLLREFLVLDAGGGTAARATTAWAAIDLATRAAVADPAPLVEGVPLDPAVAAGFASRTVQALRGGPGLERPALPRAADLDVNGHVNHARVAALLLEGLPREAHPGGAAAVVRELDLLFRAECRLEDGALVAAGAALGGGRHRLSLRRAVDGRELARGEVLLGAPPDA